MADLFPEIEDEMAHLKAERRREHAVRDYYNRWRERYPWRWIPRRVEGVRGIVFRLTVEARRTFFPSSLPPEMRP